MTHSDLIDNLAAKTGSTKAAAKETLENVFAVVTNALQAGEKVSVNGFGIFEPKNLPARNGRNPATGEAITIAASTKVGFKPAKALKDALNG